MKPQNLMRTLPNIPVDPKTGRPENWDNWSKTWKDGYLQKTLYEPFQKKTGVDLKAVTAKALSDKLLEIRIRLNVAKKLADPIFGWDLEYACAKAARLALQKIIARRAGAASARPVVRAKGPALKASTPAGRRFQ